MAKCYRFNYHICCTSFLMNYIIIQNRMKACYWMLLLIASLLTNALNIQIFWEIYTQAHVICLWGCGYLFVYFIASVLGGSSRNQSSSRRKLCLVCFVESGSCFCDSRFPETVYADHLILKLITLLPQTSDW